MNFAYDLMFLEKDINAPILIIENRRRKLVQSHHDKGILVI